MSETAAITSLPPTTVSPRAPESASGGSDEAFRQVMDKVSASNDPAPAPPDEPEPKEAAPADSAAAEQKPAARPDEDGKSDPESPDAAANPAAALPLVAQLLPAQVLKPDAAPARAAGNAASEAPAAIAVDAGAAIKQTLLGMKDGAAPVTAAAAKTGNRVEVAKPQTTPADAAPAKAGEPAVNVEGAQETPKPAAGAGFTLDKAVENRQAAPDRPLGEVQQTQIPAASAATAGGTPRLDRPDAASLVQSLPVTHPRFGEAISQQIMVLAQDGVQHAKISLNPPELGPVEVRISLRQDEASVQLAAASGVTRHAIEDALPKLRDMLDQVGVRLGDTGVFAQLPQKGGAESFAAWRSDSAPVFGGVVDPGDELPPGMTRSGRASVGLVDAYV